MKNILKIIFTFSFLLTILSISKAQTIGDTLIGQYTYYDPEGDPEYGSLYQWYRDGVAIAGATSRSYTVIADDGGHTLFFEVTPMSLTGITPGIPFRSEGIFISATNNSGSGIILPVVPAITNTVVTIIYATSSATSSATSTSSGKTNTAHNSFISPLDGKILNCSAFKSSLNLNSPKNNKEEVKLWQAFLNKEINANLPITGYYGKLTFSAIKKFQNKYATEILKPLNIKSPTGNVYKSTINIGNRILGC
jgi:hypothetical protein